MNKGHYIGKLGEDMAVKFLMKRGFSILDRNYRKKMGELDIIAKKDDIVHFCEVKSVTQETKEKLEDGGEDESETETDEIKKGKHRPEDNVHLYKQKKLAKTLQLYLLDKFKTTDIAWEFSVICVYINEIKKTAHVRRIPNIVL